MFLFRTPLVVSLPLESKEGLRFISTSSVFLLGVTTISSDCKSKYSSGRGYLVPVSALKLASFSTALS